MFFVWFYCPTWGASTRSCKEQFFYCLITSFHRMGQLKNEKCWSKNFQVELIFERLLSYIVSQERHKFKSRTERKAVKVVSVVVGAFFVLCFYSYCIQERHKFKSRTERKAVKVVSVVVGAFFVLWLPFFRYEESRNFLSKVGLIGLP